MFRRQLNINADHDEGELRNRHQYVVWGSQNAAMTHHARDFILGAHNGDNDERVLAAAEGVEGVETEAESRKGA